MDNDLIFISHSSADKAIADAICNHLENHGLKCWIAPRDITSIDWAGSIMDGIYHSEIFIVIVGHNSIMSPEVLKEVTEATRVCKYILPFKIDNDMLSPSLKYHLGPCHWLDAVTPPLEKRLDELLERISHLSSEDSIYLNKDRRKLVDRIIHPSCKLLGRQEELSWINDSFLSGERVLFLQGMGGIGKSEIAKEYAEMYSSDYDTVIFLCYTTSIIDLICGNDLMVENLNRLNDESQDLWFRRKLDAIRLLASSKVLIVLDNYDTYEDAYFSELLSIPCRFLITSRYDHEGYSTLKIRRISEIEDIRALFETNYGKSIGEKDRDTIDKIMKLVGYHTMTIELIAKQMRASFIKPEKMLERLQETGVDTKLKEKIKLNGENTKLTSFDYIRQLFKFSELTDEEKHILEIMSLVPIDGIDIFLLQEIIDLDNFDPINNMVGKSILKLDEEAEILVLHPVIADVVRSELQPDQESCYDYIDGWHNKMRDCWWFTIEERTKLYPYISSLLKRFPQPNTRLFNDYCNFINIPWICGDFEQSIQTGHDVYEFALQEYGAESREAALGALYIATSYHNKGDNDSSEPWYRKALELFEKSEDIISEQQAQCCFKVGRCARWNKNFEEAEYFYNKAEEDYNSLIERGIKAKNEKYPEMYLDFLVEKELLLIDKEEYPSALLLCKQNLKMFNDNWGSDNASSYYTLKDMGICYSKTNQYETAEQYLNQALANSMKYQGLASIPTVTIRDALIDNYISWGKNEKAQGMIDELILDLEKYFGDHNPQTIRIKKKWNR